MTSSDCREAALQVLEDSVMKLGDEPVGTSASLEPGEKVLNYDHCFVRDFAVSALAFLTQDRHDIVRNFLVHLVEMQSDQHTLDCFQPGGGLMPASFVLREDENGQPTIEADFGQNSIARVTPVDSGFWWLLLLRAYGRASGDEELARRDEMQKAIKKLVTTWLADRFEMVPTILVPDAASMIDRRMGVYGHPLDVEVLFFAALRAASELLEGDGELREEIDLRIAHLADHLRRYYWLDLDALNRLHRYRAEEYGHDAANRFNVQPESIPVWLMDWLPFDAGYFLGNLGPSRLDYRFFAQGNLTSTFVGLASEEQTGALLKLYEERFDHLIGKMPLKIVYPALTGRDWELLTGFDHKNAPWSYHNGGSWPFALWLLTAACRRGDRLDLAERALDVALKRLGKDGFPEYYDGPAGRLVGRRARMRQVWSAAGLLVADDLLESGRVLEWIGWRDTVEASNC